MRKVRWLSLGVLLVSIAYFVFYNWNVWRTKDNLGPVITMEETQVYAKVSDGEEVLLQGVTAVDAKDGDVTSSLVVESISDFVDGQTRYVNYAAFDSDNHVSKASRKLIYVDYTSIRFSLDVPLRFAATSSGTKDILGYVHAEDCLDGDISDRITFSANSKIDMYSPGEYAAELTVKNSAGDKTVLPVVITIYDTAEENAAPKIELSQYLVYTTVGNPLDPKTFLSNVTWRSTEYALTDGLGTFCVDTSELTDEERLVYQESSPAVSYDRFTIVDPTDYQTPGVYEIEYLLEDDSDHVGKVNLVVVVEEV